MDCWSKIQGRLVDLILWCWCLLVCKSSLKSDSGGGGAESSPLAIVCWRELQRCGTDCPFGTHSRAFREVLARPLRPAVVRAGLKEGGMCAILWASYSQQGL